MIGWSGWPTSPLKTSFDLSRRTGQPDLQERGAQDVPGVAEAHAYAARRLQGLLVLDRSEPPRHLLGVPLRVEGLIGAATGTAGSTSAPLGLGLLDVGRVEQHDLGQVQRGRRRVDGSREPELRKARKQAGVIDVGVGEQHKVDLGRIEGEAGTVLCVFLGAPLMHAAVHQEHGRTRLHEVARTRDLPGRAAYL